MSDTDERDAAGNPTPWALAWQLLVLDRCSGCTGRSGLCRARVCRRALRAERTRAETAEGERDEARQDVDALKNVIAWGDREAEPFGYYPYGREALPDFIAHLGRDRDVARQIVDGVHGALTDADDVLVPCDRDADLAPAVRELVRQRDVARERCGGLEAERCALPASEVLDALETALAARCHSRTVVPGEPESPECAETPTMCSRHAHNLMTALREAESAAATAQREMMNKDTEAESDADLDEDERVIAAATPGPWGWTPGPGPLRDADCAFIVRARTRWPALVAEVWRLRAASTPERDNADGGGNTP